MKLVAKTGGCSNAKCSSRKCGQTSPSSEWRCRCKRLWIKCPIHVHAVERITKVAKSDQPAKMHRQERGTNAPMPRRRSSAIKERIRTCSQSVSEANAEFLRSKFPILSCRLAERFSDLVQPEGSMYPAGGSGWTDRARDVRRGSVHGSAKQRPCLPWPHILLVMIVQVGTH